MTAFNPNAKKFNEIATTVDELADQIDMFLFGSNFSQETTAPPIRRCLIESMVRRFADRPILPQLAEAGKAVDRIEAYSRSLPTASKPQMEADVATLRSALDGYDMPTRVALLEDQMAQLRESDRNQWALLSQVDPNSPILPQSAKLTHGNDPTWPKDEGPSSY